MTSLPLTPVADVVYNLPPISAPRSRFDLGLIIGPSDVISPEDRVVVYSEVTEILEAGFTNDSPEYLSAVAYFSSPSQPRRVAIGRYASGETPLQAVQACRAANTDWYIVYFPDIDNEDVLDIAAYIEALNSPYSVYFVQNDQDAVRDDDPSNLFSTLEGLDYSRTLGMYLTQEYGMASIMGYPMGQTTDANNSAYTLKFKTMPGVSVDDLTTQQVLNIEGNNGNVYINRGNFYNMFENGCMFNGGWFGEIIYLDKLCNQIQLNVTDLLYQTPKVPQTEEGMSQLRNVIGKACQNLVNIGFIAPGVWNGLNILTLKTGDTLPLGYVVMSEPIDEQDQADRDARIAQPIYVCIKLAGAIQSVFIQVNVNR